jgi:hypothetical protein
MEFATFEQRWHDPEAETPKPTDDAEAREVAKGLLGARFRDLELAGWKAIPFQQEPDQKLHALDISGTLPLSKVRQLSDAGAMLVRARPRPGGMLFEPEKKQEGSSMERTGIRYSILSMLRKALTDRGELNGVVSELDRYLTSRQMERYYTPEEFRDTLARVMHKSQKLRTKLGPAASKVLAVLGAEIASSAQVSLPEEPEPAGKPPTKAELRKLVKQAVSDLRESHGYRGKLVGSIVNPTGDEFAGIGGNGIKQTSVYKHAQIKPGSTVRFWSPSDFGISTEIVLPEVAE